MKYIIFITLFATLNVSVANSPKRILRATNKQTINKLKFRDLFKFFRCRHTSTKFKCVTPIRNYDGDTITVDIPKIHVLFGKEISVRVLGIDTAEIRTSDDCEKEMANKAKAFVENELANAKTIHLYKIERDKYFRIGADVMLDGKSLSQKLIDENLAYPYNGDTKPDVDWCRPLDEQFDMALQ